jgi:DnaJ family protein C protein 7
MVEMNPAEPSYLTNRAASYMALKRFRSALADCQLAASLQSASPSPKTLLRLGRCQLALGSSAAALSTVRSIFATEPNNVAAIQLRDKIQLLEGHMRNLESARKNKDWGHARLALDKCLQAIDGEGEEVPTEWRILRVELELSRGNLDAAGIAAKYVFSFKTFDFFFFDLHFL